MILHLKSLMTINHYVVFKQKKPNKPHIRKTQMTMIQCLEVKDT